MLIAHMEQENEAGLSARLIFLRSTVSYLLNHRLEERRGKQIGELTV